RLAPGLDVAPLEAEARAAASAELTRGETVLPALGLDELPGASKQARARFVTPLEERAGAIVPGRLVPGPVSLLGYLPRLNAEDQEAWRLVSREHAADARLLPTLALYWADGKRSLLEIMDAVEMESGQRSPELIFAYFELLRKLKLVSWPV
ncbi:MAG: hypothetical protein Q7U96_01605, partial [Chloroflexota bacterium]|nr:hypothetical protein [Chloroflexota bacterium]